MPLEFDFITTRGGDGGQSGLIGGERRYKSEAVFNVLGDLDELVSCLGLVRACTGLKNEFGLIVKTFQQELQNLSALLATPVSSLNSLKPLGKTEAQWETYLDSRLAALEEIQTRYIAHITIEGFILPGDSEVSARLDFARAVCRRTERQLVSYIRLLNIPSYRLVQNYVNRLSDCLFVFARFHEQN